VSSPSIDQIKKHLSGNDWQALFSGSTLAQGGKLARAKHITSISAELLPTGDWEIVSYVIEPDGHQHESIISIWLENGEVMIDTSCDCSMRAQCCHSAATLTYLAKGERLATVLGAEPPEKQTAQANNKRVAPKDTIAAPAEASAASSPTAPPKITQSDAAQPSFKIRVERRPDLEKYSWLPELFIHAYAVYNHTETALLPGGNLMPLRTTKGTVKRNRSAEIEALNILYALDLLPGAEQPPRSLKKLVPPPVDGPLWAPNKKEWPVTDYYWQRFRHEATKALERRGWEVQFSPHVGLKPLIFNTDTWKAEIVEEGKGWFNLSAGFEIDGERFEIQPILATLVEHDFLTLTEGMPSGQEFLIFLPDGRGLALPVGRFRHLLETLGHILEFKFTDGSIKVHKLDAAALTADGEFECDAPDAVKELAEQIQKLDNIQAAATPNNLQATLRDYQLDGFYWMQFLARNQLNGILADDMGLGKTLQTITHILAEKESGRSGGLPNLVMAPTSVVMNWQREAAKFAPDLKVLILQGAKRHQHFEQIPQADIVMTSYALVHRDLDHFLEHTFHLVALDEAQHIKNPGAQVSQAVKQLKSRHRLCLSGTPVENHLGELWSQFSFLMPELLGKHDSFNEHYRNPIEKEKSEAARNALNRKVGPLILRRTKHDVAKELPPKTEIMHEVEMTRTQKDLYETVRSTMDKQVRQALAIRGEQAQIMFLDALLKLRQICCHPSLLENNEDQTESAKFDYLIELLETLRKEKHRVLIFSQFTSMLSIIENYLVSQDVSYLMLTGATKDRQSLVERFQGGEGEVFLISLKAGGTGLTLTGADNVIHYDPWWNPAAENQATDRAYRIGQDKPVFVHKLICKNTVEQRIQQMQSKKNTLADNILDGATQSITLDESTMTELMRT